MPAQVDPDDVVDGVWDDQAWWSTSNMGEAVPGVLTPLNWTFWGESSEHALRRAFASFGALEPALVAVPRQPQLRIMGVFHGRLAAKVSFLGDMGDRLPGTTGAAVAEQILGTLPDDFVSRNTLRRLPIIAARLPLTAVRAPGTIRRITADTNRWWSAAVRRTLSLDGARTQFAECLTRFDDCMTAHIQCVFAAVQPLYDQVHGLAKSAGDPALADRVLTGQGMHAELDMVNDIWHMSRRRLDMAAFLAKHGYHGPNEGEIASRVWREDPEPLAALVDSYARHPDDKSPASVVEMRSAQRRSAERELLDQLGGARRQAAKLVLRLAARNIPLRGVGKVAYLQVLDVARASARQIGAELARTGCIDSPDDAAFLTVHELLTASRPLRHVVAARRSKHDQHLSVALPRSWFGRPDVTPLWAAGSTRSGEVVAGTGACGGTVEGRARVVLDPAFDDVEAGEILIAPFTDPSWASVMFTSAALVVDIGSALSHAAVVARELGVPCVMGTGDGTRRVATGDWCRVDGGAGTLTILRPAHDIDAAQERSRPPR
jgi:pyruvate,water dikinase